MWLSVQNKYLQNTLVLKVTKKKFSVTIFFQLCCFVRLFSNSVHWPLENGIAQMHQIQIWLLFSWQPTVRKVSYIKKQFLAITCHFPSALQLFWDWFLSTLWKHAKPEKEKPLEYIPICSNPLCLNTYCDLRCEDCNFSVIVIFWLVFLASNACMET